MVLPPDRDVDEQPEGDGVPAGVLGTGEDLWNHLVLHGGLDIQSWDADVPAAICGMLSIPIERDLAPLLRRHAISPTRLLDAFFAVIDGYAAMLADLLSLFERIKVKTAGRVARIAFDFSADLRPAGFDYESFREEVGRWKRASSTRPLWTGSDGDYWALLDAARILAAAEPGRLSTMQSPLVSPRAEQWERAYRDRSDWPPSPQYPVHPQSTGLAAMLEVWDDLYARTKARYAGPGRAHELWSDELPPQESVVQTLELDHWLRAAADALEAIVDTMRSGTLDSSRVDGALGGPLSRFRRDASAVDERIRSLTSILNLPLWKQRSGLFSAWVLVPITSAFGGLVTFEPDGDTLPFGFRPRRMAFVSADPLVEIWSELRTPLIGPSLVGRKKGVQPDYSILRAGSGTHQERTMVVVECKQYWVPSRREFVGALHDYASSRPHAQVVLVNQGSINDQHQSDPKLEAVRERVSLIGGLKPASPMSSAELQSRIRDRTALDCRYRVEAGALLEAEVTAPSGRTVICLHLHVTRGVAEGADEEYSVRLPPDAAGAIACQPLAREAEVGERVVIRDWSPGTYLLSVHRLSDEEPWPAEVAFSVRVGGLFGTMSVLPLGDSRWHRDHLPVTRIEVDERRMHVTMWPAPISKSQ